MVEVLVVQGNKIGEEEEGNKILENEDGNKILVEEGKQNFGGNRGRD